jgi:hypothetical protein
MNAAISRSPRPPPQKLPAINLEDALAVALLVIEA